MWQPAVIATLDPRSLRVSDREGTPNLTWQQNPDCPSDSYRVYRYIEDGHTLIGSTDGTSYEDEAPPADGYLAYAVRGVLNGQETGGVSYTVRDRAPDPTPTPAPEAQEAETQRTLVCFYAEGGAIHSISGVRECTMAEINHVLSQ